MRINYRIFSKILINPIRYTAKNRILAENKPINTFFMFLFPSPTN